jgi:hypothetical protein
MTLRSALPKEFRTRARSESAHPISLSASFRASLGNRRREKTPSRRLKVAEPHSLPVIVLKRLKTNSAVAWSFFDASTSRLRLNAGARSNLVPRRVPRFTFRAAIKLMRLTVPQHGVWHRLAAGGLAVRADLWVAFINYDYPLLIGTKRPEGYSVFVQVAGGYSDMHAPK